MEIRSKTYSGMNYTKINMKIDGILNIKLLNLNYFY